MSIQEINLAVFHLLNVSENASPLMMAFGRFVAHDLIYIVFACFICAWFVSSFENKKSILKAVVITAICLSISEVLSFTLNTPRPFVMGVGHNILDHSSTGSFPSNHMTILSSIAFTYYYSAKRQLGKFLMAIACLVAWSRVYVGVHFPIDMLGAFFITWFVNLTTLKYWNKYSNHLTTLVVKFYEKLFQYFIIKGLVR